MFPFDATIVTLVVIGTCAALLAQADGENTKRKSSETIAERTKVSDRDSSSVDWPEHHYPLVPSHYTPHRMRPISCSQPPCVLPNVQISVGPKPVSETPVTSNPLNPLQMLARANDENCGSLEEGGVYSSDDGGTTWRRGCLNVPQGALGGGDPGVAYDLMGNAYATGILYYDDLNQVWIQKSSDNGQTWSQAQLAVPALLGFLADKDWLEVDTNPQSPFANTLYISVTQVSDTNFFQTSVSHSNDGGNTWTTVTLDRIQAGGRANPDELTDMAIAPDGTVYLVWLRCNLPELFGSCGGKTLDYVLSQSTDGVNIFTEPRVIFKVNLAPNNNFCCFWGALPNTRVQVVDVPAFGIDTSNGPHRGNLYLAYYNWTGTFMRVFVATSSDHGATWTSVPVAPDTQTHDQFFPWLSVSPSGSVGVSWLDRRNDPNNLSYEAFAALSHDGAASFGKNVTLSEQPSDPSNDGFGGRFIGDYTGNTWAGDNFFYATYTDTSTGVDQDFLVGVRLR